MKIFNKSRIAWTISALFLVAVTSCSKDEPAEQTPSAGKILFTGEQAGLSVKSALIGNSDFVADAGSTLKTTLNGNATWWTKDIDKIGIYSPQANEAPHDLGTHGIINNEYTANSTGSSSDFTPITAMYWSAATTDHHFYAYYPFVGGSSEAAIVPVGVLSTQSQLAANNFTHIGALDFLVATPVVVVSPDDVSQTGNAVHLVYNHLFTIVEFNIFGSGIINAIRLSGKDLALAGATVDITQTTPAPGFAYTLSGGSKASAVIVNLATAATLSSTIATKVYMVIYPGSGIIDTDMCSIQFKNGGIWKNTVIKQAPAGGFVRGQKYVVEVDPGTIL